MHPIERETIQRIGKMGFGLKQFVPPATYPTVLSLESIEHDPRIDGRDDPWDWEEEGL